MCNAKISGERTLPCRGKSIEARSILGAGSPFLPLLIGFSLSTVATPWAVVCPHQKHDALSRCCTKTHPSRSAELYCISRCSSNPALPPIQSVADQSGIFHRGSPASAQLAIPTNNKTTSCNSLMCPKSGLQPTKPSQTSKPAPPSSAACVSRALYLSPNDVRRTLLLTCLTFCSDQGFGLCGAAFYTQPTTGTLQLTPATIHRCRRDAHWSSRQKTRSGQLDLRQQQCRRRQQRSRQAALGRSHQENDLVLHR